MNAIRGFRRLWVVRVVAGIGVASILGCGGADEQVPITVAKDVPYQPATVDANGVQTIYSYPAAGTAQRLVDALMASGVHVLSPKRCGVRESLGPNGELVSIGLYPRFVVLVEIDLKDLEKAKQAEFVEATDTYLRSIFDASDCERRGI